MRLIALLLLISSSLFGLNSHDHFYSIPLPKNILTQADAIFSLKNKSQRLGKMIGTDADILALLNAMGLAEAQISQFTGKNLQKMTLREACDLISPNDRNAGLKKFLEINISSHTDAMNAKERAAYSLQ